MGKKITEHDALKGIDLLIEPLSAEERQRVFDWIALKYKVSSTGSSTGGQPAGAGASANTQVPKDIKVKEFIALKRPEGFYERIACLAYYLEKFGNMDGVKTADIVKANTEAKQTKFPNSTVYVNNATQKYKFLISSGQAKKTISAKGEALVEALPDRAKVEAALEAHPSKKRAKKKIKSKS